jgi:hypothetical protein
VGHSNNGHRPSSVVSASEPWRRSSSFEDDFLEHVVGAAGLRGPAGEWLADLVKARLAKGALEYGAEGYLTSDVFGELAEEPQDVIGWALLGALRTYLLERGGLDADEAAATRQELVAIAIDGARLWHRAEGLRQRLAGGG